MTTQLAEATPRPITASFPCDFEVTGLIHEACSGDHDARKELLDLVYSDLRLRADVLFRGERVDHTLQPTALVHDVYMWILSADLARIEDRWHFLSLAGFKMRRLLVDHARHHQGSGQANSPRQSAFDVLLLAFTARCTDVVQLDELLNELEGICPKKAELIHLRFFSGLSMDEAADHMGLSARTASRMWCSAKWWLYKRMDS